MLWRMHRNPDLNQQNKQNQRCSVCKSVNRALCHMPNNYFLGRFREHNLRIREGLDHRSKSKDPGLALSALGSESISRSENRRLASADRISKKIIKQYLKQLARTKTGELINYT